MKEFLVFKIIMSYDREVITEFLPKEGFFIPKIPFVL